MLLLYPAFNEAQLCLVTEYFLCSDGHFSPSNRPIIKGVRTRGGIRQRGGHIRVLQGKSFSNKLYPSEDKERSTNINWFGNVSNTESVNGKNCCF